MRPQGIGKLIIDFLVVTTEQTNAKKLSRLL